MLVAEMYKLVVPIDVHLVNYARNLLYRVNYKKIRY